MALRRYDPEQDTLYMEFERELWKETHGNEPMPGALGRGDDDDDEIAEAGGDDFASNLTCPITGKAVSVCRGRSIIEWCMVADIVPAAGVL